MGGGRWKASTYKAAETYRSTHNISAFDYSDSGATKTHNELDPMGVSRESRDSAEHPESTPVVVPFDVTGSMRLVPRGLQTKLTALLGLLLLKGYVPHPQIMFGAIGDATTDRAPLQVSQFESDNRMDEHLGKIYLEGNGGGQKTESYELFLYWLARHVSTDAWDKRRRRGYLFLIGDEMAYPRVKAAEVRKIIGDELAGDITLEAIVREVQQRWDVYFIIPSGAAHSGDTEVLEFWRALFGQNVIVLDDLDAVAETIALTIGLAEDATGLDDGLRDLASVGSTAGGTVGKALASLGSGHGQVTSASAPPDLYGGGSGSDRL
jgi:hypothetical protein